MKFSFEKSIKDIRRVDPERKYWFIRTYYGKTFQDFLSNK